MLAERTSCEMFTNLEVYRANRLTVSPRSRESVFATSYCRVIGDLRQDDWASRGGRASPLGPHQARMAMLRGEWNHAVHLFEQFLDFERLDPNSSQGGLAPGATGTRAGAAFRVHVVRRIRGLISNSEKTEPRVRSMRTLRARTCHKDQRGVRRRVRD